MMIKSDDILKHFAWILVVALLLSGCSSQSEDRPTPLHPDEVITTPPVEELPQPPPEPAREVPVSPPAPITLEVDQTTLETLSQPKDTSLHDAAPTKQTKAAKADKKVNVSGGVLTDDKAEKLEDSVSGGKVKIDIKLD
jgi:type IV secretory pathway VirB10-like protein